MINIEENVQSIDKWVEDFVENTFKDKVDEGNKFREAMKSFVSLYERAMKQVNSKSKLEWAKVESCQNDHLLSYEDLPTSPVPEMRKLLNKVCVLKLNGGMGTSMGLKGPKSVIPIHNSMDFLDVIVSQIEHLNKCFGSKVPLVLMNSFYTHEQTIGMIEKRYVEKNVSIFQFIQKKNPKIDAEALLPISNDINDKSQWNPPGHGDIYDSLVNSDVYQKLMDQGIEYVFLSNVDNLGATIDTRILRHLVKNNMDFCLEVTPKTLNDVKGGTLIHYDQQGKSGRKRVKLLEIAQVPQDHVNDFMSIDTFKVFNTNNMWIKLKAIRDQMANIEKVDVILNRKQITINNQPKNIIQLETACGAAVEYFDRAVGVVVPRSRFLPVKMCQDLFLIQSSLFTINEDYSYVKNNEGLKLPVVHFTTPDWNDIYNYNERIVKFGIPDITQLKSLRLGGHVMFEGGGSIKLVGDVNLEVPEGKKVVLGKDCVVDEKFTF